MSSQWTAQDVERFREQQRWRRRYKTHAQPQPQPPPAEHERGRKVALRFRREHEQFALRARADASPQLAALCVTMRPVCAVGAPFAKPRGATDGSPLPHAGHSMFNAFDCVASPEAFSLDRYGSSNQEEHDGAIRTEDAAMLSDDEDQRECAENPQQSESSLWRRRFHVQGMERHSPKLGRGALWDAACGRPQSSDNQQMEAVGVQPLQRMPLPFASCTYDDL